MKNKKCLNDLLEEGLSNDHKRTVMVGKFMKSFPLPRSMGLVGNRSDAVRREFSQQLKYKESSRVNYQSACMAGVVRCETAKPA